MNSDTSAEEEQKPPKWRLRLGVFLFVLGLVCPFAFVPVVMATGLPNEWKAVISGLLSLGIPELLWVAAAAVMGKSGFNLLKARLVGFLKKHGPPEVVSRARYRVGLFMFVIPLAFGWLAPYALHLIPGYEAHRLLVGVCGDVVFVSSLFVLGGQFWDKLRSIFIYRANAHFPTAN
jgi:hypothetical protein